MLASYAGLGPRTPPCRGEVKTSGVGPHTLIRPAVFSKTLLTLVCSSALDGWPRLDACIYLPTFHSEDMQ